MRLSLLSVALVSLLGVASALPIVPRSADSAGSSDDSADAGAQLLPRKTAKPGNNAKPGNSGKPGIAYAPYINNPGGSNCKTAQQVMADFEFLAQKYSRVRIYGTDCDQIKNVKAAAEKHNLKLFLGMYEDGQVEKQVQGITQYFNKEKDWAMVDMISYGNEMVFRSKDKAAKAREVVGNLGRARELLRKAGFKGDVVTVDEFGTVMQNPDLCTKQKPDVPCVVNMHMFHSGQEADKAEAFYRGSVKNLQDKVGKNTRIVIAEAGWPWQGQTNGGSKPGRTQQTTVLNAISKVFQPQDLYVFTAFDDLWKKDSGGTFGAEKYFGIHQQPKY